MSTALLPPTSVYYNGRRVGAIYQGGKKVWPPGPSRDPATSAYLTATGLNPSYSTALDNLVKGLKASGLWAKMLAIYPFVGGTEALHKWNLKDPRDLDAAYRLTFNQPVKSTHSTALGYRPNAQSVSQGSLAYGAYADTHLVPRGIFDQDSTSLAYYSLASVPAGDPTLDSSNGDRAEMGCYNWAGTGSRFHIIARYIPSTFYYGMSEDGGTSTTVPSSAGLFVATRTGPSTQSAYRNGALVGSSSPPSIWLPDRSVWVGGINDYQQRTDLPCGFASIGTGLDVMDNANLYTVVQQFQIALGRSV